MEDRQPPFFATKGGSAARRRLQLASGFSRGPKGAGARIMGFYMPLPYREMNTDKELCGARTRKGIPCIAPSMTNGRCRMHGGLSTEPKTPEGRQRLAEAVRRRLGTRPVHTPRSDGVAPAATQRGINLRTTSQLVAAAHAVMTARTEWMRTASDLRAGRGIISLPSIGREMMLDQ